ncbi:unnamed protein product [Scytosiphon promiscuus]
MKGEVSVPGHQGPTTMSSSSLRVIGIEDDVFIGGASGFSGSIKTRASDFVVNEIDPSGRLVEATSSKLPSPPTTLPTEPSTAAAPPQTATASTATIRYGAGNTEQPSEPRTGAGAAAGSGACKKEVKGRGEYDNSAGAAPPAPLAPDVPSPAGTATTGKGNTHADVEEEEEDESPEGWAQQLQRCLGGSASKLAQLKRIDASARGGGTLQVTTAAGDGAQEREEGSAKNVEEGDKAVRVLVGHGADKAARARVHRAVQETFPFVKTATEKDADGGVTVVCTQAAPLPALHGILSEQDLEALQRMVNRGPGGIGAHEGVTLSSNGLDRASRTLVHRAIAEAFPYLQTKTCSQPGDTKSQQVSVFWSRRRGGGGGGGGGGAGKKRKRQGSDSDGHHQGGERGGRGDRPGSRWVRFGLRKEGCEHHRTALALSKVLRVPLSTLSFAGIKDKIAITTQACVVKGVPPRKIVEINGSIPGVTVGNLSYCERGLSLGDLFGNKFSVVVRGAKVSRAVLKTSLGEACTAKGGGGFVNLFGTQRVGSPAAAARGQPLPFEIGRDVLSGDWGAAVKKILRPRDNDPPFLKAALSEFLEGRITPKECAARVRGSNRLATERLVLQGLVRYGASAFQAAIQCVPYGMRTMWVHAYQSHVWNSLACARIRLLGPEAVPGDLVYPAEDKRVTPEDVEESSLDVHHMANVPAHGEAGATQQHPTPIHGVEKSSTARTACTSSISSEVGDTTTWCPASAVGNETAKDGGIVGAAAGSNGGHYSCAGVGPDRESNGSSSITNSRGRGTVTVLTREMIDEAFASEGVTPRDLLRRVALPLPGTSIKYPTHEIGEMYQNRLEQDGVDRLMWPAPAQPRSSRDGHEQTSTLPPKAARVEPGAKLARQAGGVHAETGEKQRGGTGSGGDKAVAGSPLVPKGAYRRLLCVPTDVSWEPAAPWIDADHAVDKGFQTPSDSRTGGKNEADSAPLAGACATGAVDGEIASTRDPISPSGGDKGCAARDVREPVKVLGRAHDSSATAEIDEFLDDVHLTFTLPPGSFATMFLREVMKRNDDIAWSREEEGGADAIGVDGHSIVLS